MGVIRDVAAVTRVADRVARDVTRTARTANYVAVGQARAAERRKDAEAALCAARGTVATREAGAVAAVPSKPIDGERVLDQAFGYLGHMALWPSMAAQVTATLYAAQANAKMDREEGDNLPAWLTYEPRLFFTSNGGGCGKSWMSRLTASLCPAPERLAEMTKASFIDLIAQRHTVVVTELDKLMGTTGKRNPWLPGLANVGYEFDGKTSRKQGGATLKIPLFGPMILDGTDSVIKNTGEELRTLFSRCIVIHVTKGPEGYRPPRYDREVRAIAKAISGRMARWMAQQVAGGIADRVPDVPGHLGNRPFDLWEPMFATAEAAGGKWPELCRYACENIEAASGIPGEEEDREADQIDGILSGWGAAEVGDDLTRPVTDPGIWDEDDEL